MKTENIERLKTSHLGCDLVSSRRKFDFDSNSGLFSFIFLYIAIFLTCFLVLDCIHAMNIMNR